MTVKVLTLQSGNIQCGREGHIGSSECACCRSLEEGELGLWRRRKACRARGWAGPAAAHFPRQQRGVQEGRTFQAKDAVQKGVATDQKADTMHNEARTALDPPSPCPGRGCSVSPLWPDRQPSSRSGSQICSSASPFQSSALICDLVFQRQVCLLLPRSPGGCFGLHYQTL